MDKMAKLHFVVKKDENVYEFTAPAGAPIGQTHDALYDMLGEVLRMANQAAEKIKQAEEKQAIDS